jgi:FKBP-type peptidyl-prolyl cis-trans isomerase 2
MAKSPSEGWFALVGLDEVAGTFVADFNSEKTGESLLYEITVVKITKR